MGRLSVRPLLTEYLTAHVGEVVHLHTMLAGLPLNKAQIQAGMNKLSHLGIVEVALPSNAWIYRPKQLENGHGPDRPEDLPVVEAVANGEVKIGQMVQYAPPSDVVLEVIRELNGGRLLLQGTDGELYVATKIDV